MLNDETRIGNKVKYKRMPTYFPSHDGRTKMKDIRGVITGLDKNHLLVVECFGGMGGIRMSPNTFPKLMESCEGMEDSKLCLKCKFKFECYTN